MKASVKMEGVSPVIATILMVAITVVLAATLYLMVPDLQESSTATPPIRFISDKIDEHKWKIDVVADNINPVDLKYSIVSSNGSVVVSGAEFPINSGVNDTNGLTWFDANQDGRLNTGDYLIIENPNVYGGYEFRVSGGALGKTELPF